MNNWNTIELAAADRRARDLQHAKEAQMVRAVRPNHSLLRWSSRWLAQITQLLSYRQPRQITPSAEVKSAGVNQ